MPGAKTAVKLFLAFSVCLGWQLAGVCRAEEKKDKPESMFTISSPAGKKASREAKINIDVTRRPLRQVLDYLQQSSGMNIVVKTPSIESDEITIRLSGVDWRTALDVVAGKYGYVVEDKDIKRKIITIVKPKMVELSFTNAPITDVVKSIMDQSDANIIIGPEVKGTVTAHLKDIPWQTALRAVLKSAGLVSVEETDNTIRITTPENLQKSLETRIFKMSYIKPKGTAYRAQINTPYATRVTEKTTQTGAEAFSLVEVLTKLKSPDGVIAYERSSNSLIITDLSTKLDDMAKVIEKLDAPPKQVHITIRLIESDENFTSNIGVSFGETGLSASLSGATADTIFPFTSGAGPMNLFRSGWTSGLNGPLRMGKAPALTSAPDWQDHFKYGTLSFADLTIALKMIKTSETTKILMAPQLSTLENEEATIHVGKNIRWAEYYTEVTEYGTVSGLREARNSPIQEGLQLLVLPQITGPDNNVILTLIPKIVDVSIKDFETFGPDSQQISLPHDTQRIVVTKMLLRDGETGVIAGLMRKRYEDTESKVPFLGDIPILGWLFSYKTVTEDRHKDMLMLVTVNVIDPEREADIKDQIEAERLKLIEKKKEEVPLEARENPVIESAP